MNRRVTLSASFALSLAFAGCTESQSEDSIDNNLSVSEMQADLKSLVSRIRTIHPATVDGLPKAVERAVEDASERLRVPLSRPEFWLVANQVLLSLDDSHTSMSSQSGDEHIALPFAWLEEGMVIDQDTSVLRLGDRIIALGRVAEGELLAKLRGFIPAENDGWVRYRGQFVLTDIGILHWLGIADDLPVSVVVERDGELLELSIPRGSPPQEFDPSQPWVRYEIDSENDLGVFTLDVCRNDDSYRRRLRAFFEAVHAAGIGRIAVDVRQNTGGDSWVLNEFLRYLDINSYDEYSGEVRWSDESLRQRGKNGQPCYVRNDPWERENQRVEDLPPYTGEVYVLTSNATFSSAAWLAVMIQDNGLGEVVGEPPGNAPSSYGDVFELTLPNSNYSYRMSFKKWVRPDPGRDPANTLDPDRRIPRTRQDIVDGVDPVLAYLRGH